MFVCGGRCGAGPQLAALVSRRWIAGGLICRRSRACLPDTQASGCLAGHLARRAASFCAGGCSRHDGRQTRTQASPSQSSQAVLHAPVTEQGAWPIVLALLAWGAVAGTLLIVWPRIHDLTPRIASFLQLPLICLALGMLVGVLAGSRRGWRRRHSDSGCGVSMWLLGMCNAVSVILAAGLYPRLWADGGLAGGEWLWIVLTALPGFGLGYALVYAKTAMSLRSASDSLAHAKMISAALLGMAGGILFAGRWGVTMLGSLGLLVAACLLALAVGGLMIIADADRHARRRGLRLAMVFASLGAMMVLFPRVAPRWLQHTPSGKARVVEGHWLTAWVDQEHVRQPVQTIPSPPAPSSRAAGRDRATADLALLALRARATTACLLGRWPADLSLWSREGFQRVDVWPYDPAIIGASWGGSLQHAVFSPSAHDGTIKLPALRLLRLSRQRYDLLVEWPIDPGSPASADLWTVEMFERLRAHLGPGGLAVSVVPLQQLDLESVVLIANTFEEAFEGKCAWALFEPPGTEPDLWLLGFRQPSPLLEMPSPDDVYLRGPRLMADMFSPGAERLIHSARSRRPMIRPYLTPDSPQAKHVAQYLRQRSNTGM